MAVTVILDYRERDGYAFSMTDSLGHRVNYSN